MSDTNRNPYTSHDGAPEIKSSVFIFMDILGYQDMNTKLDTKEQQQEFLEKLHHALSESRSWIDHPADRAGISALLPKDRFQIRAFTDNIVIGIPIHSDAEGELGEAFNKVADFQLSMTTQGFFVRGAISMGNAYVDEIAVFGPALVEAYKGESSIARDPRVILTPTVVETVRGHLNYYGKDPHHAPQVDALLEDTDGQWFVNYLDTIMIAEDYRGPFFEPLLQHKEEVEKKLNEHKNNPPIFNKYAWSAKYHNTFCENNERYFRDEHKIDQNLFAQPIKKIVE